MVIPTSSTYHLTYISDIFFKFSNILPKLAVTLEHKIEEIFFRTSTYSKIIVSVFSNMRGNDRKVWGARRIEINLL